MNDSVDARRSRRKAGRTGCAVEATLSVIGGLWKPVVLFHLLDGTLRFNALCRLLPSATPRMVTLQLRELEADGIIRRTVYPEVPPKVEYSLTALGLSLEPVLLSMRAWGAQLQALEGGAAKGGSGCASDAPLTKPSPRPSPDTSPPRAGRASSPRPALRA